MDVKKNLEERKSDWNFFVGGNGEKCQRAVTKVS